jgi:hypothetical protein
VTAHVSAVTESGEITEIAITNHGKYFHDTGVASDVVVESGGRYRGGSEVQGFVLLGRGRMYEEDDTLPAIVADVTVTITQRYPSSGTGAVLRAIVGSAPNAPGFGNITSVAVDNPGDGYLEYSTLTAKPITVEFFGPDEYAVVTVDRQNVCS